MDLLVNGKTADALNWKIGDMSFYSCILMPHSSKMVSIVFNTKKVYSVSLDGKFVDCLETNASLSELHSFSMFGVTVELAESLGFDSGDTEGILFYSEYNNVMKVLEMRVEPVQGMRNRWVIGLHVEAENHSDNKTWFPLVYQWLVNGQDADVYKDSNPWESIEPGEKKDYWQYVILNHLPEGGISSIGITLHLMNTIYYCPVTVTAISQVPLDGDKITAVKADALQVSGSVYDTELVDEPDWHTMSFEGKLTIGDVVLRAELMDAQITDECMLAGWLHLINDTDQALATCAIVESLFAEREDMLMVADGLIINAMIDAHGSTWQRFELPLYGSRSRISDDDEKQAQKLLGFGPDALGLTQISFIGSYYSNSYPCHLGLVAVEPLEIQETAVPAGQHVFEKDGVQIEMLAARIVPTESSSHVYTLMRCTNPTEMNYTVETVVPSSQQTYKMFLGSDSYGLFAFSWAEDNPSLSEPLLQLRVQGETSGLMTLQSSGAGLRTETAWVPELQASLVGTDARENE